MDPMLRTMTIILFCFYAGLIAFWAIVNYFIYRRNVKRLHASIDSQLVKPEKVRFVFSWLIFSLIAYIPAVLILWLIEKEFPFIFAWLMPLLLLSIAPAAYPYYIVAVSNDKINGATRWGWLWKRNEIRLDEIDEEKLSHQHLGKKLGITVIHSTGGIKILTLGLSGQQLSEITVPANKSQG
jgi:hypothetical protein